MHDGGSMAERWLVIDDSSTIQRVIKLAFQGYDVQISEADSCQDAAREIMQGQPTLMIADAALGGVQGVQDFLALKAQAPQAPFIILEGSYDNIDEAQFRAAGFRHFLKKPFDASQLLSITRQALGRALPYRGEAAVGQSQVSAPPPPPPERSTRSIIDDGSRLGSSFPPESTSTGFDLGLHASKPPHVTQMANSAAMAGSDNRALAQTIVSTQPPYAAGGGHLRKEPAVEQSIRSAISFSLEDDDPPTLQAQPSVGSSASPLREASRAQESESKSWDGLPRAAGSHLGNLLEPMLHEEMEKLVRIAVEDYCRKHFAGIARELIQRELDRLTQDRSRLLMD